ncbi:hypothetical protein D3C81_896750 [compost metagenome]
MDNKQAPIVADFLEWTMFALGHDLVRWGGEDKRCSRCCGIARASTPVAAISSRSVAMRLAGSTQSALHCVE